MAMDPIKYPQGLTAAMIVPPGPSLQTVTNMRLGTVAQQETYQRLKRRGLGRRLTWRHVKAITRVTATNDARRKLLEPFTGGFKALLDILTAEDSIATTTALGRDPTALAPPRWATFYRHSVTPQAPPVTAYAV